MSAPAFDPAAHPPLAELGERLRELAGDAAYRAGREYVRKGTVREAAVAGTAAYATVSGSTDYRVTVTFPSADGTKVSCTCPAHRRNRYCKHVVALCTALLEQPARFALLEAAPEPPPRAAKKAAAGKGAGAGRARGPAKAAPAALRAAGLDVLDRLLVELADGGLAGLRPEKLALIEQCAELVRALKLRRLGNLLVQLRHAAGRSDALDERAFADLLIDLYLCRAATRAHLDGTASLDPRLAEDLLGKTWRAEELEPISGLELLEVAFTREEDAEFVVETSYLADVATGGMFAERQIAPRRLRGAPKPRHRVRLVVEEGGLYPGLPPRRIRLGRVTRAPLRAEDVERLVAAAPSDVAEIRRLLVERAATPFGRVVVPALFRPAALLAGPSDAGAKQAAGKTGAAAREATPAGALDAGGRFLRLGWAGPWPSERALTASDGGPVALFGLARLDDEGLVLDCLSVVGLSGREFGWASAVAPAGGRRASAWDHGS